MMKNLLALAIIFVLGVSAGMAVSLVHDSSELSRPQTIREVIPQVLAQEPIPRQAPADRVKESQILVFPEQVVLDVRDAQWSKFTDTHSMEPVISATANAIQAVPRSPDELKVGDIISYESEYAEGIFIHRIISIDSDDEGWYALVKGDNNPSPDPGRIRFSQVRRVVIAIVY